MNHTHVPNISNSYVILFCSASTRDSIITFMQRCGKKCHTNAIQSLQLLIKIFPSSFPVMFKKLGGDRSKSVGGVNFVAGPKGDFSFLFQDGNLFPRSKVKETPVLKHVKLVRCM